jgi:hypothetical protein
MKKQCYKRGSILVMSIFFMLILFITASAFLVLLPVENRAALRSEQIAQGGLVADAGINDSLAWLREQLDPKDGSASREPMAAGVYPSQADRTVNLGDGWTYRWSLTPDAETFPNGSNSIRAYSITSKAFRNGIIFRQAQAEVIQDSLSEYAALYDYWPSNLVQPVRSTSAPAGGPVHVNDVLNLWIPEGNGLWSSSGDPKYSHGLTASDSSGSSQDGFNYYQGNWHGSNSSKRPYNSSGPIESRYSRMVEGGRDNMVSGANDIDLPENTFELRDAAWGFGAGAPPSTTGVHINEVAGATQGIYIEGDVEEMQLGSGGTESSGSDTIAYGNNSWVKIEQPGGATNSITDGENYTVITVKESAVIIPAGVELNGSTLGAATTIPTDSTLRRNADGSYDSFAGIPNGVVYTNGDIDCLWGENKGKRTIAVEGDESAGVSHKIRIGGKEYDNNNNHDVSANAGEKGLVQYGATDSNSDGVLDPPSSADNVVGLIGRDVMISSKLKKNGRWDSSHPETNPLYLYAIVLGGITGDGGTYAVESYGSGGGGWAYRYGSRIMVDAGAWGTTSGHGLINGNTFYDEPAANSPPPYFPSQPTFTLKSYVELPAMDGETL